MFQSSLISPGMRGATLGLALMTPALTPLIMPLTAHAEPAEDAPTAEQELADMVRELRDELRGLNTEVRDLAGEVRELKAEVEGREVEDVDELVDTDAVREAVRSAHGEAMQAAQMARERALQARDAARAAEDGVNVRIEVDGEEVDADALDAESLVAADVESRALARALRDRATGDRIAMVGDLYIAEDEVVVDAFTLSGDIEVAGTVTGDAVSLNGNVTVLDGGKVLGDASSLRGDVLVLPGGTLAGEANTLDGSVEVQPGGRVLGSTMSMGRHHHEAPETLGGWIGSALGWLYRRIVFLLAFAGAGVLVIALFQDRVASIARALEEQPAKSGLMGLVWTIGLVVAAVATFFTILGPLAAFAVLGLAWLLGFVGLCQMLGDRLGLPLPYKHHGRWLAFLVGCLLVTFVGSLPFVGWIVIVAASLFGMGAAFQTRFGSR